MRATKFRGKRIDNGEWVYGSVVIALFNFYIIEDYNDSRFAPIFIPVDPETVGEFTNEADIAGKEIFEGDIFSPLVNVCTNKEELKKAKRDGNLFVTPEFKKVERYCVVEHFIGNTYNGFRIIGKDRRFQTPLKHSTIQNMCLSIIGNIHDNPEILK